MILETMRRRIALIGAVDADGGGVGGAGISDQETRQRYTKCVYVS